MTSNTDNSNVLAESDKIVSFMNKEKSEQSAMMLPKQRYEPFFMKVMDAFIKHHDLPRDIKPPQGNMMPHKLLSYIADLMSHSMGEDKRNKILFELDEYKEGLPFDLR